MRRFNLSEKFIPIWVGIGFVLILMGILYYNPPVVGYWFTTLENWAYDLGIRANHKGIRESFVTIVDVDDLSIEKEGRWPWPRDKVAKLVSSLYEKGATVIGFDFLFSEEEKNIVEEVQKALGKEGSVSGLDQIRPNFDHDQMFAESLKQGDSVLAIAFSEDSDRKSVGVLPPPMAKLTPEEESFGIPLMKSYIGNIEILEKAAKNGGFINTIPDEDGILRSTPLIVEYEKGIYPSLALSSAGLYLLAKEIKFKTALYGKEKIVEGIWLDQFYIPTDPQGEILIPYRGPSFTFPFVSATDVLNGKLSAEKVANKIVLIGSSATALADVRATAIAPVFVGVEIHATVAQGILDHYLPYKPPWRKGAAVFLTFFFGVMCAFIFPRLSAIATLPATIVFTSLLWSIEWWMLHHRGIVISVFFPIFVIVTLFLFNTIYGYFSESKRRKEIKKTFGEFVPPERIDEMLKKGGELELEGESKEMTVLFADVKHFTDLSEKLSAPELKKLLNLYLTPMTQSIFDGRGTIDKYVGDMIMAFWGAPQDNPKHAFFGVKSALDMQEKLEGEVNANLKKTLNTEVHLRIGINTGMMNVGDMGSKFRRAYTVLGDTVNLASRLEELGKYYPVPIIVGEKTWEETKDDFLYRKLDTVQVLGKHVALSIYEPLCLKEKASAKMIEEVNLYGQALDFYAKQNWQQAQELFEKLKNTCPEKGALYKVFLDRIDAFRKKPPDPNWDGVWVFQVK